MTMMITIIIINYKKKTLLLLLLLSSRRPQYFDIPSLPRLPVAARQWLRLRVTEDFFGCVQGQGYGVRRATTPWDTEDTRAHAPQDEIPSPSSSSLPRGSGYISCVSWRSQARSHIAEHTRVSVRPSWNFASNESSLFRPKT